MSRPHHIIYRLMVVAAATMLGACSDTRTYDHFEHTNARGWYGEEAVAFGVPRQWAGVYTMTLNVRTTPAYPYLNAAFVVETTVIPGRSARKNNVPPVRRDTVSLAINDRITQPVGQHGISVTEHSVPVCALELQEADSLHVTVRHLMQREELPGVSEIGLRLDK